MGEAQRDVLPKCLTLLDAIDEHRGAFEYDFRTRFHLPLSSIPEDVGWGEAWRLYEILANDPSSAVGAASWGNKYRFSREAMILADLFDLTHLVNAPSKGPKPKPYPRPFEFDDPDQNRIGKTDRSPEEVRALLARRGPVRDE